MNVNIGHLQDAQVKEHMSKVALSLLARVEKVNSIEDAVVIMPDSKMLPRVDTESVFAVVAP